MSELASGVKGLFLQPTNREISGLGSETGAVANGDTILAALAKINDRLPLSGGALTGAVQITSETAGAEMFRISRVSISKGLRFRSYNGGAGDFALQRSADLSNWTDVLGFGANDPTVKINGGATAHSATFSALGHSLTQATGLLQSKTGTASTQEILRIEDSSNSLKFAVDGDGAKFGTHSAIGAETVTGYITIKDAGGTSRKVTIVS